MTPPTTTAPPPAAATAPTGPSTPMSSTPAPRRRTALQQWRNRIPGILMGGPAVAVFLAMFVIPMILAAVLSFTDWNGYSLNFTFVGWDNYIKAFRSPRSIQAAIFTGIIAVVGTILCNAIGLAIAALISGPGRSNTILRTVFFYPYVISALIIGFLWSAMLSPPAPSTVCSARSASRRCRSSRTRPSPRRA